MINYTIELERCPVTELWVANTDMNLKGSLAVSNNSMTWHGDFLHVSFEPMVPNMWWLSLPLLGILLFTGARLAWYLLFIPILLSQLMYTKGPYILMLYIGLYRAGYHGRFRIA